MFQARQGVRNKEPRDRTFRQNLDFCPNLKLPFLEAEIGKNMGMNPSAFVLGVSAAAIGFLSHQGLGKTVEKQRRSRPRKMADLRFWPFFGHFLTKFQDGVFAAGILKVLQRKSSRHCAGRTRGGKGLSVPPNFARNSKNTPEISPLKNGGLWILAKFGFKIAIFTKSPKSLDSSQLRFPFS